MWNGRGVRYLFRWQSGDSIFGVFSDFLLILKIKIYLISIKYWLISAVPSFEGVITVFKNAKCSLGEILSSCEFMDTAAMECVTGQLKSPSVSRGSQFVSLAC